MDDVLAKAEEWRAAGEEVAIATVVATRRSAPRPLGSKLAVTRSGRMFGSVSGGCVEADVAERCKAVLDGEVASVVSYGIEDERGLDGRAAVRRRDRRLPRAVRRRPHARARRELRRRRRGRASASAGRRPSARAPSCARRRGAACSSRRSARRRGSSPSAQATSRRRCARWRGRSAGAPSSSTRAPGSPRASACRAPTRSSSRGRRRSTSTQDTALVSLVHEERIDIPALRRGVEGGAFYVGALGSKRAQDEAARAARRRRRQRPRAGRARPRRRDARRRSRSRSSPRCWRCTGGANTALQAEGR